MATRTCEKCGYTCEDDNRKNCPDCTFPLEIPGLDTPPDPIAQQHEENAAQEALQEAEMVIREQEAEIARLKCTPLVYAAVLSRNHVVNPDAFEEGDEMRVTDEQHNAYGRHGKIVKIDLEVGTVDVQLFTAEEAKQVHTLRMGLEEKGEPQAHLVGKNDGTNIVTILDGKTYEVWNHHRFDPKPGDTAKCNLTTNQVVEVSPPLSLGDMVRVLEKVNDNNYQVDVGGSKRVVFCDLGTLTVAGEETEGEEADETKKVEKVEVGDTLILDPSNTVAIQHIGNENTKKYKVKTEQLITWDQIGGCKEAKAELQEALVMPSQFPEIFDYYHQKIPAGIMLYGPPGCGKTLIAKASAHSLAGVHGKDAVQSGFNYIKGPEILSKWVGESEAETRAIFERMRKHYDVHGYPSVTFVDEADAIFTERGSHDAQKWHDTLVAQWLSEMDGFDQTCGMLIFATNRPGALDGAITREGRIDKQIKIPRPDVDTTKEIFGIHLHDTPFDGTDANEVVNVVTEEIMSEKRALYTVVKGGKPVGNMTLGHTISGSMIAGVVQTAKSVALRRDLSVAMETAEKKGKKAKVKPKGVRMDDFLQSVSTVFYRHRNLNHRFDQQDYCESNGLEAKETVFRKASLVGQQ